LKNEADEQGRKGLLTTQESTSRRFPNIIPSENEHKGNSDAQARNNAGIERTFIIRFFGRSLFWTFGVPYRISRFVVDKTRKR